MNEDPTPPPTPSPSKRGNVTTSSLPAFDTHNVLTWVHTITTIFKLNSVHDPIERVRILAPLLPNSIVDTIAFPLREDCYQKLIQVIEENYTPDLRSRIKDIFKQGRDTEELPSAYLARVKDLLGRRNFELLLDNNAPLAHELFLSELPRGIQESLNTLGEDTPLEKLVKIADKLYKLLSDGL